MKIPVVKHLCETYSLEEITLAEEQLAEGEVPSIQIEGEDEGEQLTHAFAAKYILERVAEGQEFKAALREFTQKVRTSIS
ncbi:MAG: hypothetical protein EP332_02380 [Bacteroidetes bacterium]|nr:MAG: hypothetical protein EP332_02380 [Bacteroidota bacterium]